MSDFKNEASKHQEWFKVNVLNISEIGFLKRKSFIQKQKKLLMKSEKYFQAIFYRTMNGETD
jgi:hypothetical protein